ncbi:MAG: PQQ-dependent dehydrogenase, methanol/ethanol family [Gemmatimonadota bacterium]|nr:PQQ-dependent dehydrogenase, methanol/ethanol family [Gemmatimonadota bacterium]
MEIPTFALHRPARLVPSAACVAVVMTALAACDMSEPGREGPAGISEADLRAAGPDEEWLTHGGNFYEDRYSALTSVTPENVAQLGLVWSYDFELRGGVEATPLIVDGVMYVTGPWSVVHAVDALTGERLWRHDPRVPRQRGRLACCDVVNRGVAVLEGKVFVGTLDGRLIALDAASGTPVWDVVTVDQGDAYTITGAPRAVGGNVVIGNGGAEYGVRGYVTAYDPEDGSLVWRTYTVPGDPADGFESEALRMAAETWSGEWWVAGGGGTAWDAFAYDPELGLLYVGTGNGSPWSRHLRSPGGGDNLYLSSILALDVETGEYRWHFQTTPGDHWDYTATQPLVLADIEFDGVLRRVIMQAPKNGFFYVLDRETGEFLSGEPYATVNWAEALDVETGRPIENPEASDPTSYVIVTPTPLGGHNWQPMAYNRETGLVYIPMQEASMRRADDPEWVYEEPEIGESDRVGSAPWNTGTLFGGQVGPDAGSLVAWDPRTQSARWAVPLAGFWNGGTMTTATGLVFQGGGDGRFVAYDASTGEVLWEAATRVGIIAAPVTYAIDGTQYVTVAAGWGGARGRSGAPYGEAAEYDQRGRIFTFALGGAAELPVPSRIREILVPDLDLPTDATTLAEGQRLYGEYCGLCHGAGGGSRGAMPNLHRATGLTHRNFHRIVLEGLREEEGMPSYAGILDEAEVTQIHAYVVSRARAAAAEASN